MEASDSEKLKAFQNYLSERSIPAPFRYSRKPVKGGFAAFRLSKTEVKQINLI